MSRRQAKIPNGICGELSVRDKATYYITVLYGLVLFGVPAYAALLYLQYRVAEGVADAVDFGLLAGFSALFLRFAWLRTRSAFFLAERKVYPEKANDYYRFLTSYDSEDRREAIKLGIL